MLTYTLKVDPILKRDYEDENSNDNFPAWEMYPNSKWNYGISVNAKYKYNDDNSISVEAIELPDWKLLYRKTISRAIIIKKKYVKLNGDYIFTPNIPTKITNIGKTEKIKLTPYGLSELRITAFPKVKKLK